ncbi:MAG: SpoIIE family protein phosphatase, partial [Leptospiraceae bacterium]|nr:SpoIIE family protein phosphatase [Leptospiraceae bacterium]
GFTIDDSAQIINPSEGITGLVLRSGDPLLVRDLERDLRINRVQIGRYKTSSFVSVPILQAQDVVGVLNAADKKDGTAFDFFEMRVLTTVANQIGDACARIESREREVELQSYRRDMETAARIQLHSLPKVPGMLAGMQIAARYEACREVGGDFYDLVYHSDDRISLLIADVAGKGVPAALFMEFSKTLLAGLIPRNMDPVATLEQANEEVYANSEGGIFVTVMLIQIERELSRLRYGSAGHNRQLLYRVKEKSIEQLSARGAPLGILPGGKYTASSIDYEPGDILVLYTDGITECCNVDQEEFGEERLYQCLHSCHQEGVEALRDRIFASMQEFRGETEPFDDSTLMLVRL